MKKALFLYFTGTYHTKALTETFSEELNRCGIQTKSVFVLEKKEPVDLSGYELILFFYPIYAFKAPLPFIDYLKKLTFPKDSKYYVLKQSGEPFSLNDASSRKIVKILKKHQATLSGEFHFLFPYNILFAYPEAWKKKLMEYNRKLLPHAVDVLIKGEEHPFSYGLFTTLFSNFISVLERFGARINGPLFHTKKKQCSKCGLCIRNCPKRNIRDNDGYPKFSFHCCLCMRCAYYCPKDAIRIGLLNPLRIHQSTPPKDNLLTRKFFHSYEKKLKELENELESSSR